MIATVMTTAPPRDAPEIDLRCWDASIASRTLLTVQRRDRMRDLIQNLRLTTGRAGAVAECGCYAGLSSWILCYYLHREDPSFIGQGYEVFDSFQGLSMPTIEDGALPAGLRAGGLKAPLEAIQETLSDFPAVRYTVGWIPASLDPERTTRYRFVHLNVDLYVPTRGALRYFWPRLVSGGVIVSAGYDLPGERRAVDEIALETGAALHPNPSGMVYLVKP